MKVVVSGAYSSKGSAAASSRTSLRLLPDSSLLFSPRPLFLPECAPAFAARPAVALRIGRLGKSIAARFAHRYVDALTAAFVVEPQSEQPFDDMDYCFDGAAALGRWQTVTAGNFDTAPTAFRFRCENNDADLCVDAGEAASLIERTSRYATLKTGDVFLMCTPASFALLPNCRVTATTIGQEPLEVLNVNVK